MKRILAAAVVSALLSGLLASSAQAQGAESGATCSIPESDAEALSLTGFDTPAGINWLTDTELTVAVQGHPSITGDQRAAISQAITTWNSVLASCLDGAVTLTEVLGAHGAYASADIVLRFIPR
jgi:hypothetical protein